MLKAPADTYAIDLLFRMAKKHLEEEPLWIQESLHFTTPTMQNMETMLKMSSAVFENVSMQFPDEFWKLSVCPMYQDSAQLNEGDRL